MEIPYLNPGPTHAGKDSLVVGAPVYVQHSRLHRVIFLYLVCVLLGVTLPLLDSGTGVRFLWQQRREERLMQHERLEIYIITSHAHTHTHPMYSIFHTTHTLQAMNSTHTSLNSNHHTYQSTSHVPYLSLMAADHMHIEHILLEVSTHIYL